MQIAPGKFGPIIIALLLIAGTAVWIHNLTPKAHVREADVLNTEGVELDVQNVGTSDEKTAVTVRLKNRTKRTAASVVFTVEATDALGNVVMENPLCNTLNLQPGESRAVEVFIPSPADDAKPPEVESVRGRVNLVRWKD